MSPAPPKFLAYKRARFSAQLPTDALYSPSHAWLAQQADGAWRVGNGAYACAISLLTHDAALTPLQIREALGIHEEIVHVTVEIHRCDIC